MNSLSCHAVLLSITLGVTVAIGSSYSNNSQVAQREEELTATKARKSQLPHLLKHSDRIYCGGEPRNEADFEQLAKLGVKTVVSVDGIKPDVAAARRHGLRYVHIPIGYDGIDEHAGLSLAKLVRETEGPLYIHCHHGLHRGPAAAAVASLAAGTTDHKAALDFLERAGTSKDYLGLWKAVENYHAPPTDAPLPELVEVAKIDSFTTDMANLGRAWEGLEACRDANWQTSPNHPDLQPLHQALLVKEALVESRRGLEKDASQNFRDQLAAAEKAARQLELALSARNITEVVEQYETLSRSCVDCHERHRD
ncbi:MAG: hypothetical protein RH917_11660 [Lacipirellulaceae bacterium]